jgi:hypothetical protein
MMIIIWMWKQASLIQYLRGFTQTKPNISPHHNISACHFQYHSLRFLKIKPVRSFKTQKYTKDLMYIYLFIYLFIYMYILDASFTVSSSESN